MRSLVVLSLALAFGISFWFSGTASASERAWLEVRSPHFRILTDGSKRDAVRVAREFEQLRWVFATNFPGARLESGAPLTVFATRDEASARALDPAVWKRMGEGLAGVFHHSWEKPYAMVRLDTFGGEGSKEVVYHEYTHSILSLNSKWIPLWLNEGWAEFYGYTRFEPHRVYLGAPTLRHNALRSATPMPIQTLISINAIKDDEERFYAQSWALVHFLTYGPGMEHGKRLYEFFSSLQEGKSQSAAFQEVFGDFKKVDKGLAAYMQQPAFPGTILKDAPHIDENLIVTRALTESETEAELGGFHLWTRDYAGARRLLEQALKDDSKLGLAHENMGFLDFSEGKDREAASEFSQASSLDGKLYLSVFAKTMLSPISNTVSGLNSFGESMGQVLQINPRFAPAYVQLARLAIRENELPAALVMSRKAEELEPSLAGYHIMTGEILRRMGKNSEAAAYAKFVADRWSGPDHNEATELWYKIAPEQRPREEISRFIPKDAQVVTGKVKSVSCAGTNSGWTLVLDAGDQTFTFHGKGNFMAGFSDTLWYGGDHFSFCHHLEGLRAIVYYHASSDTNYAGDIAGVEIRNDLPEPLTIPPETTANR